MSIKRIMSVIIFSLGACCIGFWVTEFAIKTMTSNSNLTKSTKLPKSKIETVKVPPIKKVELSKLWVNTDRIFRRTCPSNTCGVVGKGFFRESMQLHESKKGWVRITKYYDASCRNGNSEYVDSGSSACIASNGIVKGRFAEWVDRRFLSEVRPPDPAKATRGNEKLVAKSDDYNQYKDIFLKAALKLVSEKRCTEQEFLDIGGWIKSSNHGDGIYFIWCSNNTDRVYLNTRTGKFN